ncbi:hypothetical protein OG848_47740 (plasmid) [Streptomyces canus]|uniref:hypothetical protein n=1 Tax=Streptomyces canus TaxID=58343 RepID=UPI002F918B7A
MIRKTRKKAWADLVRDLDEALAFVRDQAPPIVRIRARVRALGVLLDFVLDRNCNRDFNRAVALARGLVLVLDLDLDLVRVLDRDLLRVRARARALTLDLDSVPDRVVQDVVRLLESARLNAALLAAAGVEPVADGHKARVSGSARWLVGVASRVVPVGERGRYAEEWQGELWDLGQPARGRRRRQLAHALRLLSRTWGVRGGVRAARRRPAGG